MKPLLRLCPLLVTALLAWSARAQTQVSVSRHSYLYPGDSISCDIALERGDLLEWNLWLPATGTAGTSALTIESSVDGNLVRRHIESAAADGRDSLRIARAADYRITLKTGGRRGRVADLSVWVTLGRTNEIPFPLPNLQRTTQPFVAGDRYSVTFEFAFDTVKFEQLHQLELPLNLVSMWAITALGDSLPASTTVQHWTGQAGIISLRERAPRGGRIKLLLEVDIPVDGDATIFLAPGEVQPPWLPRKARMVIEHRHDPWRAVIVPPMATAAESLLSRPLMMRSLFAAQQFRMDGLDSLTAAELARVRVEADSLTARRQTRVRESGRGYDTLFLVGERAFLPPDLHVVLMAPLSGSGPPSSARRPRVDFTWFVDSPSGDASRSRLFFWEYDEARVSLAAAPKERFWDGTVLPLTRQANVLKAVALAQPKTLSLYWPEARRPASFDRPGRKYLDVSQHVWGFYLENPSDETMHLVYRHARPISRSVVSIVSRWPKVARYVIVGLAVVLAGASVGFLRLKRRERERKRHAEELAKDMERAREVQLRLLPSSPLSVQGIEVFGLHQSMQQVGGDYYDFFQLEDGRVILCVGDVTGHGMPAALLMANLQAMLHAVEKMGKQLNEAVAILNHDVYKRTAPEHFVTMLLAEISADRTQITYCNAGHNPGYIIRANGGIEELDAGGIMLGAMEVFPFIQMDCALNRGDLIALYTDGIPEAEFGDEDMFGYERLRYYLYMDREKPLADIARDMFRRVTPAGPQMIADDMALVLVRIGK